MMEKEKTLLHYLPFAILVLNEENETVYINPKAEEIFNRGFVPGEKISIKEILSDENLKTFSFVAGRVRETLKPASFVVQENERFLEFFLSPIKKEEDVIGLIITVLDITEEMKSTFTKLSFIKDLLNEAELTIENLKTSPDNKTILPGLLEKLENNFLGLKREISSLFSKKGKIDLKYLIKLIIDKIKEEFLKRAVNITYRSTPSSVGVLLDREEFEKFLIFLLNEMAKMGRDIWVSVDEGRIDDREYGICLLTFSGKMEKGTIKPLEDYLKEEDGILEVVSMDGIGTTVGIAFPTVS